MRADATVSHDLVTRSGPFLGTTFRGLLLPSTGTTTLAGDISGDGLLGIRGTARLTGDGAATGAYEIRQESGALTIDGDFASPDAAVVTFQGYGNGIIRGVLSARQVSPGARSGGVGELTVGTAYLGGDNGRLDFDVAGTGAGSGYDQLTVLDALHLDRVFRGNSGVATPVLGVRFERDFDAPAGQEFLIIDNRFTGLMTSTFANLPEGSFFTAGDVPLRITCAGGDGNDVVVTWGRSRRRCHCWR